MKTENKNIFYKASSMKKALLYSLTLLTLAACEETVILDLEETMPKMVIEGQVTDRAGYQFVKISKSTGFYATGKTPRVTDATVVVDDNAGNHYEFVHNPRNHADSAGYYLPQTAFTGVIDRIYTLTVVAEGQTYTAQDKLNRITTIDKLEYRIDEDEREDPEDPGRFYEVLMFVKEPQETRDYYLFKTYRNDSLTYGLDTDVYYADDELVGESIDGFPLPIFYAQNDLARAEVYSLTRDAYIFYRDLYKVLNNDGGMFSQPPADPRTNLSNGALGLFQVSAVVSSEIRISE